MTEAMYCDGALWSPPLEIVVAAFEGTAAHRLTTYLNDPDHD